MLKKSFFSLASSGLIVLSSWFFIRLAGLPRTPLSLLATLSLFAVFALAVFFVAASLTYRSDGTNGGMGVLSMLIVCLGGTVIACSIAASVFGTGIALLYIGAAAIAGIAALAIAALSGD